MKDICRPLLVVCGPTASGKTGLAIDLALRLGGEVVSADSMQVYKGMDIGTAKPTPREMRGVPHHLISIRHPDEAFSVAQYAQIAREAIADIHARGKLPVLAGGTGLYIKAIADNIQYGQIPRDADLREELRRRARDLGTGAMLERLREIDPELGGVLHPNDIGRIIRAIEVYELTGRPMSLWQKQSRETPGEYQMHMLGLTFSDRVLLYERIEKRIDIMLDSGLIDEAKQLYEAGFSGTASQAIGYKELFGFLDGKQTLEEAVSRLRQNTRRYAKRQLTWFGRDERIRWLYMDKPGGYEEALAQARRICADNK